MKYKVGETARVRKDLVVGNLYGSLSFIADMAECSGKTVTIKTVGGNHYRLKEFQFSWTDEMLEPCTFTKADLMTGDVVEIGVKGKFMVLLNTASGDALCNEENWLVYEEYNENLDHCVETEWNITKVYRPTSKYQMRFNIKGWKGMKLIWEREKPIIELTLEDIAKLKGVSVDQIRIKE